MGRRRGTVRFASRTVVSGTSMPGHGTGPLECCTPNTTSKGTVVVTTKKWAEPVLAWLVASKYCGGGKGGGFGCVVCGVWFFVEVAG